MAFGVFILPLKRRTCLYRALLVINSIEIFLGIAIAIVSMYIYIIVAPVLAQENAEISFIFVVFGLYGTQIIFQYAIGLKIASKSYHRSHKKSTRKMLELWLYADILLVFNLIIISVMLKKITKHMVVSTTHALQIGVINYLKDINWKKEMDKIQIQLECCGVYSYKDWYEYDWIPSSMIIQQSSVAKHFSTPDGKYYVVPWSCCKMSFPMQCLHDPLQQIQSQGAWDKEPTVVADSLNAEGCLIVYERPINAAILFFEFMVAFIVIFTTIGFLMARILFTSCRNALILEAPAEPAPGWIFGRGDCGYFRGHSLADIMEKEWEEMQAKKERRAKKAKSKSRSASEKELSAKS